MANYPEEGELVIASVNKIMPYGAFCSLDEYANLEAFLHVSELSSGWVKNVRDFVKDGQKIVAVVTRVDLQKRQIDLSLKRASEADKRRKMESYQMGKRAEKLLERAAIKLKRTLRDAYTEAGNPLIAEFGDLYSALKGIKAGEVKSKIPPIWMDALKEIAEQEIKQKEAKARLKLTIASYEHDGVEKIREALQKALGASSPSQFHYVGAPHYYLDLTRTDHKQIEKAVAKIEKALSSISGVEHSLEKEDKA